MKKEYFNTKAPDTKHPSLGTLSFKTNVRAKLADCLSVRDSDIHGVGLFANDEIEAGTTIQKTHFNHKQYGWINFTPNAQFNHSKANANCKLIDTVDTHGGFKELVTIKLIKKDEEILMDYNTCPEIELPQEGWVE